MSTNKCRVSQGSGTQDVLGIPRLCKLELPGSRRQQDDGGIPDKSNSKTVIPRKDASSLSWERGRSLNTSLGFL